jgi:hypothetical protein
MENLVQISSMNTVILSIIDFVYSFLFFLYRLASPWVSSLAYPTYLVYKALLLLLVKFPGNQI